MLVTISRVLAKKQFIFLKKTSEIELEVLSIPNLHLN